jgi:death on curing protein
MSPFLEMKHIDIILKDQLDRYGGEYGIRDQGLAESAVATPEARFGGENHHDGPVAQAAAYLFHLCSNHPFLDGNKRVALAAALVFLDLHGIEVYDRDDTLYELVMGIARAEVTKEETKTRLEELCSPLADFNTAGRLGDE